jgi:hypothetical protein
LKKLSFLSQAWLQSLVNVNLLSMREAAWTLVHISNFSPICVICLKQAHIFLFLWQGFMVSLTGMASEERFDRRDTSTSISKTYHH